jgi:hypothetical protein
MMSDKVTILRNGWTVFFGKSNGWYEVLMRDARGEVHDNIRCDDYRNAQAYRRLFIARAKGVKL